ncbi:hypothetical protein X797_000358 [Metarhizium robertsii]|uniref:Uncharacterized protein n=1 Tax=Metarhizium robertsii TaxID=568076 RepID=A0A0A1V5U9_9HYPO|nr:hypothetical protein X797_000358 [Metarhizium robertsii]
MTGGEFAAVDAGGRGAVNGIESTSQEALLKSESLSPCSNPEFPFNLHAPNTQHAKLQTHPAKQAAGRLLAQTGNQLLDAVEGLAKSLERTRVAAEQGNISAFDIGWGSNNTAGNEGQGGQGD